MKFIRLTLENGEHIEVNVSHVERVQYHKDTNCTTFTCKHKSGIIVAKGDWSNKWRAFIASGAVWTDGKIYEYAH